MKTQIGRYIPVSELCINVGIEDVGSIYTDGQNYRKVSVPPVVLPRIQQAVIGIERIRVRFFGQPQAISVAIFDVLTVIIDNEVSDYCASGIKDGYLPCLLIDNLSPARNNSRTKSDSIRIRIFFYFFS